MLTNIINAEHKNYTRTAVYVLNFLCFKIFCVEQESTQNSLIMYDM